MGCCVMFCVHELKNWLEKEKSLLAPTEHHINHPPEQLKNWLEKEKSLLAPTEHHINHPPEQLIHVGIKS